MTNLIYRLELDYNKGYTQYDSLQKMFDKLKSEGHIFVLKRNENKALFFKKANEFLEDIKTQNVYVEPSTSLTGDFCESIDYWIENLFLDSFYNPEKRPYIEVLSKD